MFGLNMQHMGMRTYAQRCDTAYGHVRNLDIEFIYYCTNSNAFSQELPTDRLPR